MRRFIVALVLVGCSSSPEVSTTTDSAAPTCATTSCVPGASCRLPSGGMCQCFDAGEWACGSGSAFDAGAVVDTRSDTVFVAPPADTAPPPGASVTFPAGACAGTFVACTADPLTMENGRDRLRNLMTTCGFTCNWAILELTEEGCPWRLSFNFEPVDGALACMAKAIASDRYQCATKINVDVSIGCLD